MTLRLYFSQRMKTMHVQTLDIPKCSHFSHRLPAPPSPSPFSIPHLPTLLLPLIAGPCDIVSKKQYATCRGKRTLQGGPCYAPSNGRPGSPTAELGTCPEREETERRMEGDSGERWINDPERRTRGLAFCAIAVDCGSPLPREPGLKQAVKEDGQWFARQPEWWQGLQWAFVAHSFVVIWRQNGTSCIQNQWAVL